MVWFKHGIYRTGIHGAGGWKRESGRIDGALSAARVLVAGLLVMSGVSFVVVSAHSGASAQEVAKSAAASSEDNVIPLSDLAGDWKSVNDDASMTVKVTGKPGFELLAITGKDAQSSYQIHCLEIGGVLNCLGHGQDNTSKSAAPFLVQSYMRAEASGLSLLETWMVRGAGEDAAGQTKWVKADEPRR